MSACTSALRAAAFLLPLVSAFSTPAVAAPQILGLVASNGSPTPLVCERGECSAIFTSFCLQELREGPSTGQAYDVAPGGTLTLLATTPQGEVRRLAAPDGLRIAAVMGFSTVRVSVPEAVLSALGVSSLAVEVGPNVSLLPKPIAMDPEPQTEEEIALATGAVRQAGGAEFDAVGPVPDAARVATRLINALPRSGEEPAEARNALWARVVTPDIAAGLSPEGLAAARQLYRACELAMESRSALSLRSCLQLRHAELVTRKTQDLWKTLGGS